MMGKHDSALSTLSLLKQQYPKTKLEHYADMRPAAIYEYGKGQPQKALEIYQATLRRYPDHMYAPYIHKQIERLQKVIEEQVIEDALEDLAVEGRGCRVKSVIVRRKMVGPDVALR